MDVRRLEHTDPQLVSGGAHPTTHTPSVQVAPPVHATLQVPQCALVVSRFVSQPSDGSLLQSPKPVAHWPTTHAPP
jgi:hypothetical protein